MRLVSVHLTVYVLLEMPPRRAQARDPVVPEGYVRVEDVQRMIDEALAERASPSAARPTSSSGSTPGRGTVG
jgi:hypothetical protein